MSHGTCDTGMEGGPRPAATGERPHDAPLVSILIRSMDRPTLRRALDTAAAQTWPNLEIVVVAACGASHRPLPDHHDGRPVRLVFAPDGGRLLRPAAANAALEAARGEWLNFLDDDDEFLPHHVATLMDAAMQSPERVLYSRTEIRDADNAVRGHSGSAGFHAQLYFQHRSPPVATLFHRSLVDRGVRFDPSFDVLEDRDFMINCAQYTPFRFVNAVTCVWHAYIGDSGCGHGGNDDAGLNATFLAKLRQKWDRVFAQWLAQPEALLFLGQHCLREGRPDLAREHLENALRQRPGDINALNLCAVANLRTGQLARAEALIRSALAVLPDHPALRENLAMIEAARRSA